MTAPRGTPGPEELRAVARFAGLELDPRLLEEMAPPLLDFLRRTARLDEVELGDTEPAFILPLKLE